MAACRGCANLQCSCFTTNSDSTTTTGNGSQYAPFTFRPDYVPSPRPFGHLYGITDQSLDGSPYTLFELITPDIDQGGNMNTGNRTRLTASADGIYLIGTSAPFQVVATDNLIDNISIRKNSSILVSTGTFAHNATIVNGSLMYMSCVTLLDLNIGDTVDMFVERVSGAGSVFIDFQSSIEGSADVPHLWAIWMGGPI